MAIFTKSQMKDIGWDLIIIVAALFLIEKILPAKFRGFFMNA